MLSNHSAEGQGETRKPFREVYPKLLELKGFSQRKLAQRLKELDPEEKGLSDSYLSNLGTGKQKPTKENFELIANVLGIKPQYFKEYREYLAKEKVEGDPKLADALLDDETVALTSRISELPEDEKRKIAEEITRYWKEREE